MSPLFYCLLISGLIALIFFTARVLPFGRYTYTRDTNIMFLVIVFSVLAAFLFGLTIDA